MPMPRSRRALRSSTTVSLATSCSAAATPKGTWMARSRGRQWSCARLSATVAAPPRRLRPAASSLRGKTGGSLSGPAHRRRTSSGWGSPAPLTSRRIKSGSSSPTPGAASARRCTCCPRSWPWRRWRKSRAARSSGSRRGGKIWPRHPRRARGGSRSRPRRTEKAFSWRSGRASCRTTARITSIR